MVFQSVTILVILVYVNYFEPERHGPYAHYARFAQYFRDFCIYAMLGVTVLSGVWYIQRAIGLFRCAGRGFEVIVKPSEKRQAVSSSGRDS